MPRRLDVYFASRFAAIYFACLAAFLLLFVLVDSISQYGSLADKASSFGELLRLWAAFYAAYLPLLFCRVLSAVTLVAAASFTVTLFLRANELTPIMACGISLRRALAPILVVCVLATGAAIAVQELLIPANGAWIRETRSLGKGRSRSLHAKHFDARHQVLVVFREYQMRKFLADGVLIKSWPGSPGPAFLLEASRARWVEEKGQPGWWQLEDGWIQNYDPAGKLIPEPAPQGPLAGRPRLQRPFQSLRLDTFVPLDLKPQDLVEREASDPYLWLTDIWQHAHGSSEPRRWWIRFYTRLADPLHGLVLVLLGIPLILTKGTRNIFLSAIAAVVLSALYFITFTILVYLGNKGAISPGVAAGLAPLVFGSLGFTMYWRMPS